MAIEYDWMGSDGLVKHEETHNFGGEHHGSGYMNGHNTSKNQKAGKMSQGMFKDLFRSAAYRSDGTHNVGTGNSKEEAKKFLKKTFTKYSHEKAKKAGLE